MEEQIDEVVSVEGDEPQQQAEEIDADPVPDNESDGGLTLYLAGRCYCCDTMAYYFEPHKCYNDLVCEECHINLYNYLAPIFNIVRKTYDGVVIYLKETASELRITHKDDDGRDFEAHDLFKKCLGRLPQYFDGNILDHSEYIDFSDDDSLGSMETSDSIENDSDYNGSIGTCFRFERYGRNLVEKCVLEVAKNGNITNLPDELIDKVIFVDYMYAIRYLYN